MELLSRSEWTPIGWEGRAGLGLGYSERSM